MSDINRKKITFAPRESDTLIATARRERRAAMKSLIGSMFGR